MYREGPEGRWCCTPVISLLENEHTREHCGRGWPLASLSSWQLFLVVLQAASLSFMVCWDSLNSWSCSLRKLQVWPYFHQLTLCCERRFEDLLDHSRHGDAEKCVKKPLEHRMFLPLSVLVLMAWNLADFRPEWSRRLVGKLCPRYLPRENLRDLKPWAKVHSKAKAFYASRAVKSTFRRHRACCGSYWLLCSRSALTEPYKNNYYELFLGF